MFDLENVLFFVGRTLCAVGILSGVIAFRLRPKKGQEAVVICVICLLTGITAAIPCLLFEFGISGSSMLLLCYLILFVAIGFGYFVLMAILKEATLDADKRFIEFLQEYKKDILVKEGNRK